MRAWGKRLGLLLLLLAATGNRPRPALLHRREAPLEDRARELRQAAVPHDVRPRCLFPGKEMPPPPSSFAVLLLGLAQWPAAGQARSLRPTPTIPGFSGPVPPQAVSARRSICRPAPDRRILPDGYRVIARVDAGDDGAQVPLLRDFAGILGQALLAADRIAHTPGKTIAPGLVGMFGQPRACVAIAPSHRSTVTCPEDRPLIDAIPGAKALRAVFSKDAVTLRAAVPCAVE